MKNKPFFGIMLLYSNYFVYLQLKSVYFLVWKNQRDNIKGILFPSKMSEWTLYSKNGVAKVVVKELDYHGEFMGESHVTFDLDSPVPVEFAFGDYLTYRGEKYTLRELPSVEKQARRSSYGGAFRYENITLQGMEWEPTHVEFTDYVPADNNIHYTGLSTFSFYCDHPSKLLERIQACMDVAYSGTDAWTFVLSPDVDLTNFHAETIDISSGTSCWAALALMYSKWKIPYTRVGKTVTVGATAQVTANTYEYGKGNGLLKLKRVIDTDKTIVTRLRAYGSDKNMPYRYYNNKGFISESMYMPYLMLPAVREHQAGDGHDVFLQSDNVSDYGIIDAEIHFDGSGDNEEIYPTLEGMTATDAGITTDTYQNEGHLDEIISCDNPQDNGVVADGNYDADHPVDTEGVEVVKTFEIIVPYLGFDWHDKLTSDGTATIIMKSGMCSAREFEVLRYDPVSESDVTKGVRLTLNRTQDEVTSYVYPNKTWTMSGGDKYVITGIEMPDTYVIAAENRLQAAAEAWLADNDHPNYRYEPSLDNIYLKNNPTDAAQLIVGNKLAWVDADLGFDGGLISGDVTIRTLSISEGKAALPEYEITLNDTVSSGTIEQLTAQVDAIMSGFAGGGGISLEQVLTQIRNVGGKMFLSKIANDVAQGVITVVKGLFVGDGTHGIDENGNATLNDVSMNSAQTPSYSGTDIVSDKGFKVWEDNEGKSHMMVDYFSARVKAFFSSLEIRKIEHSAGNRIESPAGNTLALVKKFDASGHEVKDLWYARRYKFAGVNLALKLVHMTGQFFGLWQEDPSATVAFYRCYWTAEDKEEKKAVVNNWKVGDQAFCQTFNLRNLSGYVSNKRYWRLVENIGYDTIEGTQYAYIDLSNTLWLELTVDGVTKTCKGYETSGGQNFNDAPEAGDDVACLGNQIIPEERGGAIQYITYGEVDDTTGIPCVKTYSGIGGDTDYPFDLDRYLIQKQSPKGVYMRADKFEILSASGTGSSTLTCERGAWQSNQFYGHNDIVQHHGSTWLCVVAVGTTTQVEPSESVPTIWQVYARRGTGAPQAELDSANAVVSANYEGKISNISQVTGLPTAVEVYVEGNQIPTSDWDLANSYIKWKGKTHVLNGLPPLNEYGVVLYSITINTGNVAILWEYRPETRLTPSGTETIHPVINPTDFIAHIEFTHNGEAQSADISIPMIVQKAAANVQAQYSADNSSWHSALAATDLYVRYSYDGGTTWTQGKRFVGKSIEFSRAITLYATYAAMVADDPRLDGVYLCNTDSSTPTPRRKATAWQKSGNTYTQITITDEVNYLTSSEGLYPTTDGHLFNADDTSTAWTDLGVIQGADGIDGISVTLDPATVIFEQNEDNIDTFTPSPSSFTATVNVWKGTTPLASNSYKVAIQSTTNCTATKAGNQITSLTLGQDGQGVYYSSGSVVLGVWLDPTSTSQTPDTTLTFNWAANLLGTWKMSVREDTMRAVSEQECAIYDENGDIIHVPFSSVFGQSAQNIFASVQGLKGRTGIDIEDGTITLDAERTVVTNDFEVKKVKTIPTESGIQIQIAEGLFQVFGLAGVANWRFGVNAQGQAILSYYNDAGQELYNLGPDGLSTIDNIPERFTAVNNRYIPSSLIGKGGDTTHNIGSNAKILALLKSSVWEDMFKVRSIGNNIYLYGARKTVTSGGTVYYGRDTLPAEVTYSATAAIASIADGKYFTAREDLQNATTGAAVNSVRISSAVGLLVTSLQRIEFEGMTDSAVENTLYGLKIQHYNPYKSAIYDQLAVTDPGWFCNTFPTLSDIRANTIQIYTAILQDMAGNMFTVLQRKVYT